MERIRKCPFCGGEPTMYAKGHRNGYMVYVKCQSCSAQSGIKNSRTDPEADGWGNDACETVIGNWNRRYYEELVSFMEWEKLQAAEV